MTDDEMNLDWSRSVAELTADALVDAKIISKSDLEAATKVIAEEIYVRLTLRDGPSRENWRYQAKQ